MIACEFFKQVEEEKICKVLPSTLLILYGV